MALNHRIVAACHFHKMGKMPFNPFVQYRHQWEKIHKFGHHNFEVMEHIALHKIEVFHRMREKHTVW
ncbi:Uncharacterised protein [Vibrio cholerae]|uniref:Uncharacterized protein n=1 Tax=Vibrio cholerae TaxID=666 RepID=A0A655X1B5_VIBCL|nr:Uncharacterised protein [Vibrio cholerae]CSC99625.1 Uncharacterised protein [Vibrio cholerae]